jgi:CDP-6-deoxy-D-xylo-4-hexulose-3-dehydrase
MGANDRITAIPPTVPPRSIPASSPVLTAVDWQALHDAVDAHWLTSGPKTREFERLLAAQFGVGHALSCNSGSSANLLAVAAMVEAGHWRAGDEILTVACAFPTTVNPLLLYGLVPVFVDIDPMTLNVSVDALRKGVSAKTRGVMLAHTLGNPFDLDAVMELARVFKLHVVEDCCDALGSTYAGKPVGSFGLVGTCSFFPAHHITTGEGGAVVTKDDGLGRVIASVRDWGRDCYCVPGSENTCGKRFCQQLGGLPFGYDHKYTYSHLGFNLQSTEIGCALGVAQIGRASEFIRSRQNNYDYLKERLHSLGDSVVCATATQHSLPSWFGFPITIREPGLRPQLQQYLSERGIGSRLVFAGNITRQPYMRERVYRVAGSLEHTDKVMNDALWLGVWPGLTEDDLDYVARAVREFFGDF